MKGMIWIVHLHEDFVWQKFGSIMLSCPGDILQVKASHSYKADDADELSFEAGEIISVIPFDNPDEQACNFVASV